MPRRRSSGAGDSHLDGTQVTPVLPPDPPDSNGKRYAFGCDDFDSSMDRGKGTSGNGSVKKALSGRRTSGISSRRGSSSPSEYREAGVSPGKSSRHGSRRSKATSASPRSPLGATAFEEIDDCGPDRYAAAKGREANGGGGLFPLASDLDEDILNSDEHLDEFNGGDYREASNSRSHDDEEEEYHRLRGEVEVEEAAARPNFADEPEDEEEESEDEEDDPKEHLAWRGRILPSMKNIGLADNEVASPARSMTPRQMPGSWGESPLDENTGRGSGTGEREPANGASEWRRRPWDPDHSDSESEHSIPDTSGIGRPRSFHKREHTDPLPLQPGASPSAPPLTNSLLRTLPAGTDRDGTEARGTTIGHGSTPNAASSKGATQKAHHYHASTWSAGPNPADDDAVRWPGGRPPSTPPESPRVGSARAESNMHTPPDGVGNTPTGVAPAYVYGNGFEAWAAMVAYDASLRVCLTAADQGFLEAHQFLNDGAFLLRTAFGLHQVLLQPGQGNRQGLGDERGDTPAKVQNRKRNSGVVKLQVKKIKMSKSQGPSPSPKGPAKGSMGMSMVRQFKDKMVNLRSGLPDPSQDGWYCDARLKSMAMEEQQRIVPGSHETLSLHPESVADEILLEVYDARGCKGLATIPVAAINDEHMDRVRWVPFFGEGETEAAGRLQLSISYFAGNDGVLKGGVVAETLAYDTLLEVALRMQGFQRRQLYMQGPWHWLLNEFAATYGVSDCYKSLRYLAHIMEVATPTEDCLLLLHDLLVPIVKARAQDTLTRQEKRILADVEEQVRQLLQCTFEHYKVLDEGALCGISEAFVLPSGYAAPALSPAVMLYSLLHDVLLPEAQANVRSYFQTAARKRCRRHLAETDELVVTQAEAVLDANEQASAFGRMRATCLAISNEIRSDIGIHNQHIFPSFIDLPSVTSEVYVMELNTRLKAFLRACPPSSPAQPVADLLHTTADLQHDLQQWGIKPLLGGMDAKELFGLYLEMWIQDLRMQLLDLCKSDKARWMPAGAQAEAHATSPFVEEMYERVFNALAQYEGIMSRWPEFTVVLENALCDVERGLMAALEKAFAEQLAPLRDIMGAPKKFTLQALGTKLTRRRSGMRYEVPPQVGVLLNTIKRLLETLRPQMESEMRLWVASLPADAASGRAQFGERLAEVTVELRAKYRNTLQAIIEKLCENAHMNRNTYMKRILQDTKAQSGDDMSKRMQPLATLVEGTLVQLDSVLSARVFMGAARGLWDRQARDVLHFLENRKENMSWYKSSSAGIALEILDNIFTSHMQKLQGHSLQEKDLEPPRSVMEARSMLAKDMPNGASDSYALF